MRHKLPIAQVLTAKNLIGAFLLTACLAGSGLRAEETNSAMYLLAGGDAVILANSDANSYFGVKPGQIGTQGYGDGVLHLGLQFGRMAALEASFNAGPFRNYEVVNYNSNNPSLGFSQVKTNWTLLTYTLTPAITWAWPGTVNFLGLRLGVSSLDGKVNSTADAGDGSYDQEGTAPVIGVLARSSAIFAHHFSIGLELGYDYIVFNDVSNSKGTGTYSGMNGTAYDTTPSGQQGPKTSLNFSGPHIAITLGLWSDEPVSKGEDYGELPTDSTPAH
ncbi:MAG TPA: hypothetical protein VK914_09580 [bacterium]|jgi:hypothetical protein|nr:hypothetical protein [bacterium]